MIHDSVKFIDIEKPPGHDRGGRQIPTPFSPWGKFSRTAKKITWNDSNPNGKQKRKFQADTTEARIAAVLPRHFHNIHRHPLQQQATQKQQIKVEPSH